jgi:hypothetical protein
MCIASGVVGGEAFSIDASLIKADVDKTKRVASDQPKPPTPRQLGTMRGGRQRRKNSVGEYRPLSPIWSRTVMTGDAAAAPSCLRHRKLYRNRRLRLSGHIPTGTIGARPLAVSLAVLYDAVGIL